MSTINKAVLAAVAALAAAALVIVMMVVLGTASTPRSCSPAPATNNPAATITGNAVQGLSDDQVKYASIIIQVGLDGVGRPPLKTVVIPTRGLELAIATAKVESDIANLDYGDRDSVGLFQQRAGWGTKKQRMDPKYASRAFYAALLRVTGWETKPFTEAAQAVQRSGFPDRYGKQQSFAERVVRALTGDGAVAETADPAPQGQAAPSAAYVYPTYQKAVGTPFHGYSGHSGTDFRVPTGTDVMAFHEGTVKAAGFVVRKDGSPSYGYRVLIDHGNGLTSLYAHNSKLLVKAGDHVDAGTLIAKSGATGRTTGPHVHFELQRDGTAFDAIPFLKSHGATVGKPTPATPGAAAAISATGTAPATPGCTGLGAAGALGQVTIATWNTFAGNPTANAIEGVRTLAQNTMVICLQEIGSTSRRNAVAASVSDTHEMTAIGNAVPILWDTRVLELATPKSTALPNGSQGEVFGIGKTSIEPGASGTSIGPKPISWVELRVKATGATFTVVNLHWTPTVEESGHFAHSRPKRVAAWMQQNSHALAVVDEHKTTGPVFETGDMNFDAEVDQKLGDRREKDGPKASLARHGMTSIWDALGLIKDGTHSGRTIDYINATDSPGLLAVAHEVGGTFGSDHNMVRGTYTTGSTDAAAAVNGAPIKDAGSGGQDPTTHLTPRATAIRKAVIATYGCKSHPVSPCVSSVGGWRPSDSISGDHPGGRAVDVMVANGKAKGAEVTLGNNIAAYVKANASASGVTYIIWNNRIWSVARADEGWRTYCSTSHCPYGTNSKKWTPSMLHQNHVHVSVKP